MFRRALLLVTALCTIAAPAHAQFVVIDPANLVQTDADRVSRPAALHGVAGAVPDRAPNGAEAGEPRSVIGRLRLP